MAAVEFVADRATKAPANLGEKVRKAAIERGLFTRAIGDTLAFAPPLMINADEIDQVLQIVGESIAAVTK
jgi:L-2,4-diaminobutyrate transaminase